MYCWPRSVHLYLSCVTNMAVKTVPINQILLVSYDKSIFFQLIPMRSKQRFCWYVRKQPNPVILNAVNIVFKFLTHSKNF